MKSYLVLLLAILSEVVTCTELRGSVTTTTKDKDQNKNVKRRAQLDLEENESIKVGLMDMTLISLFELSTCNMLSSRTQLMSNNIFNQREYVTLDMGGVQFSEKFAGMTLQPQQKGVMGFKDVLKGKPTSPLSLEPNNVDRENVYAQRNCVPTGKKKKEKCGVEIMGRTRSGFKGVGTVAALFKKNMSRVTVYMKTIEGTTTSLGTNGAEAGKLRFFTRKGKLLGQISLGVRKDDVYQFSRFQGDIAGFILLPEGSYKTWQQLSIQGLCYER